MEASCLLLRLFAYNCVWEAYSIKVCLVSTLTDCQQKQLNCKQTGLNWKSKDFPLHLFTRTIYARTRMGTGLLGKRRTLPDIPVQPSEDLEWRFGSAFVVRVPQLSSLVGLTISKFAMLIWDLLWDGNIPSLIWEPPKWHHTKHADNMQLPFQATHPLNHKKSTTPRQVASSCGFQRMAKCSALPNVLGQIQHSIALSHPAHWHWTQVQAWVLFGGSNKPKHNWCMASTLDNLHPKNYLHYLHVSQNMYKCCF